MNEPINIGQKGVLILETEYDDAESNIFKSSDIESLTRFNGTFSGVDKNYLANCRLWKPQNENIRIICKFNENLISGKIKFEEAKLIYENYEITLMEEDDIKINQLDSNITVLYSNKQEINITDKEYYILEFKKEVYNKDSLILYKDKMKNIILDCDEESELLKCKLSKTKILEILSNSGEKYELYQSIKSEGYLKFNNVFDITINYDNKNKIDIYLNVTKLLTPFADKNTFIIYETNITKIPHIITDNFKIVSNRNDDINCLFINNNQNENKLFLLCNAESKGTFRLGNIENQTISNINIQYNFKISEITNDEVCTISENEGTKIYSVYPNILDFNKNKSYIIEYKVDHPERFNNITLNEKSSSELECINKKGIKECIVPSNHFSESGNYYTYYNNSLGHKIVLYEISTININLESKENKEDKPDNNLVAIIIGSTVGGIVLISIILLLIWRCKRKRNITQEEITGSNGKLIPSSVQVELRENIEQKLI